MLFFMCLGQKEGHGGRGGRFQVPALNWQGRFWYLLFPQGKVCVLVGKVGLLEFFTILYVGS